MSGWKSWKGNEISRMVSKASDKAIQSTLEEVGQAADQEIPLDEGTLKSSKFIDVRDNKGLISYGGGETGFPKVPYAVRWHENSANFQKGRKSRYLADPFNRKALPALKKAMAQELKDTLK